MIHRARRGVRPDGPLPDVRLSDGAPSFLFGLNLCRGSRFERPIDELVSCPYRGTNTIGSRDETNLRHAAGQSATPIRAVAVISGHTDHSAHCPLYARKRIIKMIHQEQADHARILGVNKMKDTFRALVIRSCLALATALCCDQLHAADPYKWCAVDSGGGTNCGFITIEQCRTSVSGVGGFCEAKQIVPANLSPAARAAAPKIDASGGKDKLMDCVTASCRINCSPNVKKRFRPKWCVHFKEPAA